MSNLVILFIHFIATLARLLGPGGVRSIVAESLILKHQLLIVTRSRQRSPNLCTSDRILAGKPGPAAVVRTNRIGGSMKGNHWHRPMVRAPTPSRVQSS
jgi:hypothetical protein